ncbi:tetratricopeptide repeat protein [Photobacterium piscicola]|uniref:Tetratricopeptide repeat protein n=1 Tax=Photobacterium piscicola TaxID=1378299 RepID=A0ABU6LHP0_9GAMM|nr:tetratricopeptide repeat protein [Photobacterium piscicola]MEC6884245.1 tetratricopeptide repeat protein [Photobacterium piscicola]MEC6897787.1 tetratricopeptide repeat protein [Photobacterium piscicola]
MMPFNEQELNQMPLVDGAIAFMAEVEADFPTTWVQLRLTQLAQEAEQMLMGEVNPRLRLDGLLRLFYREWGFQGDLQQYFSSENAFLDKVLERRKGIPVSLGAILLYLAKQLELPVENVGFPTQFLLKVVWSKDDIQYINPFDGEFVSTHILRSWLIGHRGPFAEFKSEYLDEQQNNVILSRWLTVMKSALLREEQFTDALRCSDLALVLNPGDPHEIRDRGYIYQQLNCLHAAAVDYSYFIEQCPEDPAADLLKLQVDALYEEPLTLH